MIGGPAAVTLHGLPLVGCPPAVGVDPSPSPVVSAPPDTGGDGTAAGHTGGTDSAPPPDDGLVGARVDPPFAPPAFVVLDQAGAPRTEAWLVGAPTVRWLFASADGAT